MYQKQPTLPAPMPSRASVIVADSSRMGSQLLADALQRDPGLEILEPCSGSDELFSRIASRSNSIVLLGANFDDEPQGGLAVARQVRTRHPETRVIILLDSSKKDLVVGAFGAGAQGVFCRSDS